jgi:hypothetical protein
MMEESLQIKRQETSVLQEEEWVKLSFPQLQSILNQIQTLTFQVEVLQQDSKKVGEIQEKLSLAEQKILLLESNQQQQKIQSSELLNENSEEILVKDSTSSYATKVMEGINPSTEEFTTVLSKKGRKKSHVSPNQTIPPNQTTSKPLISPLRAAIKQCTAKEEILKKLIQPPVDLSSSPPTKEMEKTEKISSVYLQVQLCTTATRDPLFSFSKVFEAVTTVKPLGISLVSKNVAEILFASSASAIVESNLPKKPDFTDSSKPDFTAAERCKKTRSLVKPGVIQSPEAGKSSKL